MKRYLIHILEFYLIAGTLCACGYAALLLGGYFDQAPRAVYIQQEGAEGAFADQIAAMLGDDLRLTIADSGDDLLTQATELLESDACALVLDLKTIPENAQALTELAREKQIALIWLGARPDAKVLEYENSWYVGSDPAQAGELLGEQAAMLFREGTAADRNADLLLQYVWAGNTAFADAGTLQQYILDECEHYGVYTAQVGSLNGTEQDLAEQAGVELAEPSAQPEILFFSDPQALESMELARPSLPWWAEDSSLPVLTTTPSREVASSLIQKGQAAAVAWYDGTTASQLVTAMLRNTAALRFVGQGEDIQPDGQFFAVPYQLMTA